MLQRKEFVEYGDQVIITDGQDAIKMFQATTSGAFSFKGMHFMFRDMIGRRYGSKLPTPMRDAFVTMLHPTTYLWPDIVNFRTQILYQQDISLILYHLDLRPGSVVIESGTGSGVLTTSLARSVAPHGHVHSFEFHGERVAKAQIDFDKNGVSDVISLRQRDVLENGFPFFPDGVDAAFLDLPQPHSVLDSVDRSLRPQGRVCNFSPCIEQVQRVCLKLQELGYEDIFTVEILARRHELLSSKQSTSFNQGASLVGIVGVNGAYSPVGPDDYVPGKHIYDTSKTNRLAGKSKQAPSSRNSIVAPSSVTPSEESDINAKRTKTNEEPSAAIAVTDATAPDDSLVQLEPAASPGPDTFKPSLVSPPSILDSIPSYQGTLQFESRPYPIMRGHTGYLTFARKRASTTALPDEIVADPFGSVSASTTDEKTAE